MFNSNIISTKNKNIFKLSPLISIETTFMKLLYPIQENFNNIILKTEFTNLIEKKENELYQKIKQIEQFYFTKFQKYLDDNYYNKKIVLKSQINQTNNFKPFLITKVLKKKYKIETIVVNEEGNKISLFDLKPKNLLKMNIFIDNLWISNNNELVIKWKISTINLKNL